MVLLQGYCVWYIKTCMICAKTKQEKAADNF